MLSKRLELTYSVNYESLRSKKCLNSSTDCKSERLLELAGYYRMGMELRPPPPPPAAFFFFFMRRVGSYTWASEVLNYGDGGLCPFGIIAVYPFFTFLTGAPPRVASLSWPAFFIFLAPVLYELVA